MFHNQTDYILVRKRFRSGVNGAYFLQSFSEADIGSNQYLLMMTFYLCPKRISKPKHTRLKFDLEKLKDPNVFETFQAMKGGKFAPLTIMINEVTDMDSMITTFNTAVTKTASKILDKHRKAKSPGSLQTFLISATKGELVSWCFEPSQPRRITSGLKTNFSLSPCYSLNKL